MDFKKILSVDSSLYEYEWTKLNKESSYTLVINPSEPLNDITLNKRKEEFTRKLFEITERYHKHLLKDLNLDFDPIEMKSWHHSFNLNDKSVVKDIVPFVFPEKVEQVK